MGKKKQSDKIIVALDTPDLKRVKKLVKALHKVIPHFKIGSELFTAHGPDAIKTVRWAGGHVFLDLKYHDIPNTVDGAIRQATELNVFMMTVHAIGGFQMMEAAHRAAEEAARKKKVKRRPKIVGVTVLTSFSEQEYQDTIGVGSESAPSIEQSVIHLARMAERAGLDGIVASGRELALIRSKLGRDLLVVTPGIRPKWSVKGDQSRIMTPKKALDLGADYLVIGRPITESKDPVEAAERVVAEIA